MPSKLHNKHQAAITINNETLQAITDKGRGGLNAKRPVVGNVLTLYIGYVADNIHIRWTRCNLNTLWLTGEPFSCVDMVEGLIRVLRRRGERFMYYAALQGNCLGNHIVMVQEGISHDHTVGLMKGT